MSDFEKSAKIIRFVLLMSGIMTVDGKYNFYIEIFINKYLCYINFVTLHSVVIGEIMWILHGIHVGKSFVELSIGLPLINISILGSIKTFPLFFNRDVVITVLDTLKSIYPVINEDDSELVVKEDLDQINKYLDEKEIKGVENKIAKESLQVLNIVSTMLFSVSAVVLLTFCFTPFFIMLFIYFKNGDFAVIYPYAVLYWFDIYNTRYWPLIYVHQVLATFVVCCNVFASELLFYLLCSYLEMHFRILCVKFENINGETSRTIRSKLTEAVKRHQQLIYIADLGEKLFSKSGLFNMVSSSVIICLSAFNITMADDINTLFAFTTFLMLNLLQTSLLCFYGNKLMDSSSLVTKAVYKCPWYNFDHNTKEDILIILMRASKPCKLTAGKFADLNLRTFTTILSRSWSYFALLKTVYNK